MGRGVREKRDGLLTTVDLPLLDAVLVSAAGLVGAESGGVGVEAVY